MIGIILLTYNYIQFSERTCIIIKKVRELVRSGNSIIFDGEYLDIYLKREYFDKGLAEPRGRFISTYGLFVFEVKTQKQVDEGTSGNRIHTFKFPNKIEFSFTEEFQEDMKLESDAKKERYRIFRLHKGDMFLANVNIEQSAEAVKDFIFLFHAGKLPNFIEYNDIIKLYYDLLDSNKVNLKSNSLTYELIISELCRYKKDVEIPYRLALDKNPGPNDYINYNLRALPRLNSTFAALSFENMNDSIVSSIRRTATGGTEKETPLERIIKY